MTQQAKTQAPNARTVALDLIARVLEQRRPLEEAFERHAGLGALEPRDRQFVRALVMVTLRHLGQIDRVLTLCLERPLPERARPARDLMRLGAAELLILGTPAHAAVDSPVTLASTWKKRVSTSA